jgi:hypothetical protein
VTELAGAGDGETESITSSKTARVTLHWTPVHEAEDVAMGDL